jgi:hypothetical protein
MLELGLKAARTYSTPVGHGERTVESVRQAMPGSPWAIAGYVLGGIFGLLLLVLVFSMMVSSLFR